MVDITCSSIRWMFTFLPRFLVLFLSLDSVYAIAHPSLASVSGKHCIINKNPDVVSPPFPFPLFIVFTYLSLYSSPISSAPTTSTMSTPQTYLRSAGPTVMCDMFHIQSPESRLFSSCMGFPRPRSIGATSLRTLLHEATA